MFKFIQYKCYYANVFIFTKIFLFLLFSSTVYALPPGPFIEPEKIWQQGGNPAYPFQPYFGHWFEWTEDFYSFDFNWEKKPSFADLDADGDLDLITEFTGHEQIEMQGGYGLPDDVIWYRTVSVPGVAVYENKGSGTESLFKEQRDMEILVHCPPFTSEKDKRFPALLDPDGDGDLDMVVGCSESSRLAYLENIGTPAVPQYAQRDGEANPWNGLDVSYKDAKGIHHFGGASPTPLDLDADGDWDLLVTGAEPGTLVYFENTGNPSTPRYVKREGPSNPWDGIQAFYYPAALDADADGDWDLVGSCEPEALDLYVWTPSLDSIGCADGSPNMLLYLENIGNPSSPLYVRRDGAENPWVAFESLSYPVALDWDHDGDWDLAAISMNYNDEKYPAYLENRGDAAAPRYILRDGAENPWGGVDAGKYSAPAFLDLDGDGDWDVVAGNAETAESTYSVYTDDERPGQLLYFENIGTATAPRYQARRGADNPWYGMLVHYVDEEGETRVVNRLIPVPVDLDTDGDWDVLLGTDRGTVGYFENIGDAATPRYVARQDDDNPWASVKMMEFKESGTYFETIYAHTLPVPWDGDADGDYDILISSMDSTPVPWDADGDGVSDTLISEADFPPLYFENIGTSTAPSFVMRASEASPLAKNPVPLSAIRRPLLPSDLDADGDLDFVISHDDHLTYMENTGGGFVAEKRFLTFDSDVRFNLAALKDLDGDDDPDILLGRSDGTFRYFENKNLPAHERAFNWAESVVPELLPPPGDAFELPQMSLRYYAASGVYLFYHSTDGQVYLFAPPYAEWQALGTLENYAEAILAAGF